MFMLDRVLFSSILFREPTDIWEIPGTHFGKRLQYPRIYKPDCLRKYLKYLKISIAIQNKTNEWHLTYRK